MLKRSVINQTIDDAIAVFKDHGVSLPPFAYWTLDDFKTHQDQLEGVIQGKLGWDVTNFGFDDFFAYGRTIFTLRNGYTTEAGLTKPYSQKLMFFREGQKSPIHYHKSKTEDIINFAGGNVIVKLWHKTDRNKLADEPVTVLIDGIRHIKQPGEAIRLTPGESLCVIHGTYHQFWAEEGRGHVISMEVSSVNDDTNDNVWYEGGARYPEIEEDAPTKYLLCYEYNKKQFTKH